MADCHLEAVIESMVIKIRPRRIWVILYASGCACLGSWAQNHSTCVDEDFAVPGLNSASLMAAMASLQEAGVCKTSKKDKPTGWFLQQFLKLEFAASHPEIADYVLLWDSDMLALEEVELFLHGSNKSLLPLGGSHGGLGG